ncbi:hypothetical protein HanLR1_Chr00c2896g0860601 [Helianthus annuus]|nr:hypothetical protein HanLR1_Chr00c2896g0860601 [Helianthus annuus]
MPHKTRPMAAVLLFTGLNVVLVSTISPVYDFVCFLPYWERRRTQASGEGSYSSIGSHHDIEMEVRFYNHLLSCFFFLLHQ